MIFQTLPLLSSWRSIRERNGLSRIVTESRAIFSCRLPQSRLLDFLTGEALAKLLKALENRHSGQAKHDPESRIFKRFWIPAPAPDPIRGSPE
jgi:hypothetical protein